MTTPTPKVAHDVVKKSDLALVDRIAADLLKAGNPA